ncbi:MAG TPA: hydroxysqualene dehydroxylase HpnE [Xanthobacteraceae bacterium]|jgi:squalene-associated FAD-dependent desaturase
MAHTIHIIGAGLSGLAAAVDLASRGEMVVLHEATGAAGGRCRSYYDHSIAMTIDNGNHLLLAGNTAALSYMRSIGAIDRLVGPPRAEFSFIDFASGDRWLLRLNNGRLPWWIFDSRRRLPDSRAADYFPMARLLWGSRKTTVGEVIRTDGIVYQRLVRPLLLAALNLDPAVGSAALAGAVIRETLAAGGRACRPLIAQGGLSPAFIEPALAYLVAHNAAVRLEHQLHSIRYAERKVAALDFGRDGIMIGPDDAVILAVPPYAAASLVPGIEIPNASSAILNAHFRIEPPSRCPPIIGVLNAMTEWLFAFPGRLSVTISAADRLLDEPREGLAKRIWAEVAAITGLPAALPPWQIVRERRATFAATPEQNARRPAARTHWVNLVLAGDWTDTGLPATIESAIRSGRRAAGLISKQ